MTSGADDSLAGVIASATFKRYSSTFLKVEDELGKVVPFDLNDPQEIVYKEVVRQSQAGRPIRILILKGRQQGMSTFCQAYLAWRVLTTPGTRCITVAHTLAAVHDLYGKFDRCLRELPTQEQIGVNIIPEIEQKETGRRIKFADPMRCFARFDSAQEPEKVGRAGTFQCAHLTEVPQWAKPHETMQAVLATIPDHPDTAVFIETTAKGMSDWFYEAWIDAQRALERGEEPEFYPVFVPWFKTARYQRKRRNGEPMLSAGERKQRDQFKLSNEQMYWYRDQRKKYGERVAEEFPFTWQEAFLSAGLKFFRNDALAYYRDNRREPLKIGRFRTYGGRKATFEEYPGAPTYLFETPDKDHRYVIGVDFASGRAKDSSAIVVIDVDTKTVVATHQSKLNGDEVLDEAVILGTWFNHALIVPERSGLGQAYVDRLVNQINYRNVYIEDDPVKVKHHKGLRAGWATSNSTRQWMTEEMARYVHSRELVIPCSRIVDEMHTFVYTDDEGKHAAADEGSHDDLVMATAIAIRGFGSMPPPATGKLKNRHTRYRVSGKTGY